MRQIYPEGGKPAGAEPAGAEPAGAEPAGAELAGAELARLYAYPEDPGRPWVRANMIASADGAATIGGRSGGLGGAGDRALLQVLRGLADVILVGGGTARAESYRPVRPEAMPPGLRAGRPATPPVAVLTGRLDLDPESPLLTRAQPGARTIVLTTRAAPPDRRAAVARHADVIVAGADRVTPGQAVAALAGLGHARILTEGGPGLLAQVADAGLLDELCLTISPVLAGGQAGRILAGPLRGPAGQLRLAHVLADEGYLFCRYLTSRA